MRNMIEPIRSYAGSVKIIGHFNVPQQVISPRSHEYILHYSDSGTYGLPFDDLSLEEQRFDDIHDKAERFYKHDLMSKDQTQSTHNNLLFQYFSLNRVYQMVQQSSEYPFDAYLFLRPDLQYLDRLPVAELLDAVIVGKFDIMTPQWHQWWGLNDRFAFCSTDAASVYCGRFERIGEIVQRNQPMNAEMILQYCVDNAGLRSGVFGTRALRVRADGRTLVEGFELSLWLRTIIMLRKIRARIF